MVVVLLLQSGNMMLKMEACDGQVVDVQLSQQVCIIIVQQCWCIKQRWFSQGLKCDQIV